MKLSCDVIRDLLPLYADRAASADTAANRAVFLVSGRFTSRAMRSCMVFFPPVMVVEQHSRSPGRSDRRATMSTSVRP